LRRILYITSKYKVRNEVRETSYVGNCSQEKTIGLDWSRATPGKLWKSKTGTYWVPAEKKNPMSTTHYLERHCMHG